MLCKQTYTNGTLWVGCLQNQKQLDKFKRQLRRKVWEAGMIYLKK